MITGMTNHFMFYFRWICTLNFLYFNLFSGSFCITFLSDDIATSYYYKIIYYLLLLLFDIQTTTLRDK
jgi:hypothetical protein